MQYTIKRGDQAFGPYSLSDLQQYVQSGNIAASDLARSEGMTDWLQVSQILGNIPAPAAPSATTVDIPAQPVPLPPNLHWIFLLILVAFTRQLFNLIWAMILANWARKMSGDNKPMVLVAMYPAGIVAGILTVMVLHDTDWGTALGGCMILGGLIMMVVGIFSIRSAMEDYYNSTENIGLTLSGVMTFFFGTIYLQYHVNRLHRWKKSGTEFPL